MTPEHTARSDLRRLGGRLGSGLLEVAKLVREMLVIPAQLWLALAELLGFAVLAVWGRALVPAALASLAAVRAVYRLALRRIRPVHGVAVVTAVAIVALAASQWTDYRGVVVGTDGYSPSLELVAPAPEVSSERAGEAHSWVMVPLAAAAFAVAALALRGRKRLARLLVPIGVAVIVIAVVVDRPKALDEGSVAIAYQGAEARLLEGFWLQIAAGAVLIACGLLLPRYIGVEDSPPGEAAETPAHRAAARLRAAAAAIGAARPFRSRGIEEPTT